MCLWLPAVGNTSQRCRRRLACGMRRRVILISMWCRVAFMLFKLLLLLLFLSLLLLLFYFTNCWRYIKAHLRKCCHKISSRRGTELENICIYMWKWAHLYKLYEGPNVIGINVNSERHKINFTIKLFYTTDRVKKQIVFCCCSKSFIVVIQVFSK